MDDIKEKIKQALRHIWTNKYRLFLCLLTLCCLFGLVHYFKSADSATASTSFNYSEAALGMNPNKTRFNAYEIVSDEVMERAIRRVGLQDSLTASQLAECLYLSPDGTGSANGSLMRQIICHRVQPIPRPASIMAGSMETMPV